MGERWHCFYCEIRRSVFSIARPPFKVLESSHPKVNMCSICDLNDAQGCFYRQLSEVDL